MKHKLTPRWGCSPSKKTRAAISAALKDRPHSPARREKMRAARLAYLARVRAAEQGG